MKAYWLSYIDGALVNGIASRIDALNPSIDKKLAECALTDAGNVVSADMAAKRAHLSGTLSDLRPVEHGHIVQAMGHYMLTHIDEIARILTLEQCDPLWEARIEVEEAAPYFEYYGDQAESFEGHSIPLGKDHYNFTTYEPHGVSAQIISWSNPIEMTTRSLSAALASSNAGVIKTPELTPFSNSWFASAAETAGLPERAVNILYGLGHESGSALSTHTHVNQIVFTGPVPTGIAIATITAKNVVSSVLKLGRKSAAIAHDDADLNAFANGAPQDARSLVELCTNQKRRHQTEGLDHERI
ncbi:aldehyde dehydrogenase family protein [Ruegeria conchae]|uniref:Aldehyde dehydrogenase family protein n=1 Tax=Ruegeria conchae TaxID=981384 RepID=A0A497ZU89_9RHOB|nr:aldehyde dehydrogenase family protein [Ruegeria conchae]RLK11352.1 aldehyde dehydrogenase family protein [Ruegeria conchae]